MNASLTERGLGKSGPITGPVGIGTWAIGGPFFSGQGCHYPTGAPLGYGQVIDEDSIRAIHCAVDLGAKLFDTADAYGTGHGERILGEALKERRGRVIVATKFGNTYDEKSRELTGVNVSADYIRWACEASLKRLRTDWIDLYQLHVGDLPIGQAEAVADALDKLRGEGLIRYYAWSTDDPKRAAAWGQRTGAVAVQFDMNVFEDAPKMLLACETYDYAGIVRVPLAMGFLTGKFSTDHRLPDDDIRSHPPRWLRYFDQGGRAVPQWTDRLSSIKEILTSEGRTLPQGALAWIWGRSTRAIPIPGARTVAQVEENLRATEFGPLRPDQMREIDDLLQRS